MKRVVLCGYGRFGRVYAQHAQDHSALEVVGVVELGAVHDAVRAAGLRPFDTLREALDVTHPHLVVVATPPAMHAALAVEALQRFCHVMLAKPGAVGMDDADTICTVAWSRGRSVVVDYTPTESPEWHAVVRSVSAERVVTARFARRGWVAPQDCGALWDLAPHDVALALMLHPDDRVVDVTAKAWWLVDSDEPAGAWLFLQHASGRVTRIEVDWVGVVPERRVEVLTPTRSLVWDQLAEPVGSPDNITRAFDRALRVMGGEADDTDRLREVTRILSIAEHSIYTAQEAIAA